MAGRIDADAGIAIFQPCAAKVRVLLDDRIVIARLAQLDPCGDAGHAAADHQHAETGGRMDAAGHVLARHRAFKAHLVVKHRHDGGIDIFTHADAHHPAQQFRIDRAFHRRLRVGQQREEAIPQILRHFVRHVRRRFRRVYAGQVGRETVQILAVLRIGRVNHQQARQVGVLQRPAKSIPVGDGQGACGRLMWLAMRVHLRSSLGARRQKCRFAQEVSIYLLGANKLTCVKSGSAYGSGGAALREAPSAITQLWIFRPQPCSRAGPRWYGRR